MILVYNEVVLLHWVAVFSRRAIAQRLRVGEQDVTCHLDLDDGMVRPQFSLSGMGLRRVKAADVDDDMIREVFAKVWREELGPVLRLAFIGLQDVRYGYQKTFAGTDKAPQAETSS